MTDMDNANQVWLLFTLGLIYLGTDMALIIKYSVYALIFIILLSLLGFYLAIRPIRFVSSNTPATYGVKYEQIAFTTSDNIIISGWFVPSKKETKKTIILLHGYPADKGDILPSRLFLYEHYNLLFLDFRYLGNSKGNYSTVGAKEVRDVLAAIAFLKTKNIDDVAIWGLSMGGAVGIMTSARSHAVKAVIAESPYANLEMLANNHYPVPGLNYIIGQLFWLWSKVFIGVDIKTINPAKIAAATTMPLLVIFSKFDQVIPFKHGQIYANAAKQNNKLEVIIVDDKLHGEPIDDYQQVILNFLQKNYTH